MNETNFSLDDYLAHHGVKNQKWGVQNGPPYPLDSSVSTGSRLKTSAGDAIKKAKKSFDDSVSKYKAKKAAKTEAEEKKKAEAAQKAKEKVIARSNVQEIDKIKDTLTTKEFEEAVKRAELNKRLTQADTSKSKLERVTNGLNTMAKLTGAGIDAWNNFAKISNTFTDSELPVIGKDKKDKKEKKEKKSDDKK